MNKDIAIKVDNLSKVYKLYNAPIDRLKESLHPLKKSYHKEFYALNDVSFEMKKGETVGIVGKNGSGKSTLLKIITGVLNPTSGKVKVNGRVAALLELGAGFNPEYTGMENIYFQGNLMGYSRDEMHSKLQSILDFADIGEFIDQPFKSYSSGMAARLAFAVSINVDPDILIVDEALSVGDVAFQRKCFARIDQIKRNGATILFVSHSLDDVVKHCSRSLLINQGKIVEFGESRHVINVFRDLLFGKSKKRDDNLIEDKTLVEEQKKDLSLFLNSKHEDIFHTKPYYQKSEYRWGNGGAQIIDYVMSVNNEIFPKVIYSRDILKFRYRVFFEKDMQDVFFGFVIKTLEGIVLYGSNSYIITKDYFHCLANHSYDIEFDIPLFLNSGKYFLSCGVTKVNSNDINEDFPIDRRFDSVLLEISNQKNSFWGLIDLNSSFNVTRD